MEKDELKYNAIIDNLRKSEPRLENPGDLTEKIMFSVKKNDSNITKIITLVRPWISAAAVFLVGLYFYQTTEIQLNEQSSQTIQRKERKSIVECLSKVREENNGKLSFMQGYSCYIKHLESKNKTGQLILKYQEKL